MNIKQLKALTEVVDYLYRDEKKDFDANPVNGHIFQDILVLEQYLEQANEGKRILAKEGYNGDNE